MLMLGLEPRLTAYKTIVITNFTTRAIMLVSFYSKCCKETISNNIYPPT